MHLNEAGKMIEKWYAELTNKFPDIEDDEYIIMPNHVHFIIHKIDQNKPDQQKMNNPRRGEPICPPIVIPSYPYSDNNYQPYTNNPNIVGADLRVRPKDNKNSMDLNCIGVDLGGHIGPPLRKIKKNDEQIMEIEKIGESTMRSTISKIVQWFKTMTTNEYIRRVKQDGWKPFNGRLWQRNYYEHIIRNEIELNQIREYIMNNPLKWLLDRENL